MFKFIERILVICAAFALFVLMCITLVDVVGRTVFHSPLPGATELTEINLAFLTFLAYPVIAYRQQHIAVDILDPILSSRLKRCLMWVSVLIGIGIFVIIAWRLWLTGLRSIAEGDQTGTLGLPLGYVFCWMAVMSALTVFMLLGAPKADAEATAE